MPTGNYNCRCTGKDLVINEDEAKAVRKMFTVYNDTHLLSEVYRKLKRMGVRNRNNRFFHKTSLAAILRNPVYAGITRYDGKLYEGQHDPIVTKKVFEKAQNFHKKRPKCYNERKKFLFDSFIRCRGCGLNMTMHFVNKQLKNRKSATNITAVFQLLKRNGMIVQLNKSMRKNWKIL